MMDDRSATGLRAVYRPVVDGDRAMRIHLRLLAERASTVLVEQDQARRAGEIERARRIPTLA